MKNVLLAFAIAVAAVFRWNRLTEALFQKAGMSKTPFLIRLNSTPTKYYYANKPNKYDSASPRAARRA